jgi:hypothetical protein
MDCLPHSINPFLFTYKIKGGSQKIFPWKNAVFFNILKTFGMAEIQLLKSLHVEFLYSRFRIRGSFVAITRSSIKFKTGIPNNHRDSIGCNIDFRQGLTKKRGNYVFLTTKNESFLMERKCMGKRVRRLLEMIGWQMKYNERSTRSVHFRFLFVIG